MRKSNTWIWRKKRRRSLETDDKKGFSEKGLGFRRILNPKPFFSISPPTTSGNSAQQYDVRLGLLSPSTGTQILFPRAASCRDHPYYRQPRFNSTGLHCFFYMQTVKHGFCNIHARRPDPQMRKSKKVTVPLLLRGLLYTPVYVPYRSRPSVVVLHSW